MPTAKLYACLPAPNSVPDFAALLPQAKTGASAFPGNERILAATLCRAVRYDEALKQFDEAKKNWPFRAWDWLFMAIIHHHLGNDAEARESAAQARRWTAKAEELRVSGIAGTWDVTWFNQPERAEVEVLQREVDSMLSDGR